MRSLRWAGVIVSILLCSRLLSLALLLGFFLEHRFLWDAKHCSHGVV
jgi:hypothetical protein